MNRKYGPLFFCSLLLTPLDDDDDSTKGDRMDAPWKVHHKRKGSLKTKTMTMKIRPGDALT